MLDLALREPPKDTIQSTAENVNEGEEAQSQVTEVKTEREADTQKEADKKPKEKVTLKELADQRKPEKVPQAVAIEEEDNKIDNTQTESVEQEPDETKEAERQLVSSEEFNKDTVEVNVIAPDREKHFGVTISDDNQPVNKPVTLPDEENQPVVEPLTLPDEENQPVGEAVTDAIQNETAKEITPEDLKADLKEKQALMLQEDTTDSEVMKQNAS